jgi:hypothetical protein
MGTEHEGPGLGDVTVALSWEQPGGTRVYQSWIVCECAHLAENFHTRLGEPANETVASQEAYRAVAAAVEAIPGAVHTGEGF